MKKLTMQNILKELIRIPSITGDVVTCQTIIKRAQDILRAQKVPSKIVRLNTHYILVWGETNLKKSMWLINSHLDVVPGKPVQFKPRTEKNQIFGRGSADTKGSAAILLADARKWVKLAKAKHIIFMLVLDEETGGESTKLVLDRMPILKGAIFLEPTEEKIIIQAKGIMQIKIQAIGKACHGSRPWEGVSALEQLTTSLNIFRAKYPSPAHETKNTTFNFSILQSGNVINQVPNEATLWCDVRWNPKDNPQSIIGEIKKSFNKSRVEIVKLESPINCPKSANVLISLSNALQKNKISPKLGFEHGSSDARHCATRKIPAIVFGPKGKNLHADQEWVSLKSLEAVSKVLGTCIELLN